MAILNNNTLAGSSGQGGGYTLKNSLRFRNSASANLNRLFVTGNRKTWTWSAWVKRGQLSTLQMLWMTPGNGGFGITGQIRFNTDDTLKFIFDYAGGAYPGFTTTQVFRDPSAWYHIVVVVDTTETTASDRVHLYVNGEEVTSGLTVASPGLNANGTFNTPYYHYIGRITPGTSYFDGYLTEYNFVDGQALTPTSFGETDNNGTWIPKEYEGTYGTTGFYLKFDDTSSVAALGTDSSGNGNDFTPTNISLTAGATYDSMTDVPTLTDEDTSNFATWNPLGASGLVTNRAHVDLYNGNLSTSDSTNVSWWGGSESTILMSAGKHYAEFTVEFSSSTDMIIGINGSEVTDHLFRNASNVGYRKNGTKYINASNTSYGASYTNGDIIGVAFDADTQSVTFYKNNVSQGAISVPNLVNRLGYSFYATIGQSGGIKPYVHANFGQRPFSYTPPSGFKKLNTFNLPDSTIEDGSKYFNTVLYTGDATYPRTINGFGFQPDFVWAKPRSIAYGHMLFDVIRGVGNTHFLDSRLTSAEGTSSVNANIDSFDSDGYIIDTPSSTDTQNANNLTVVSWGWKGGGTGVSNTDGTITSQVSANPTAGFSVVTYTEPSSGTYTVGHGLGVAPSVIILKTRSSAANWVVFHKSISTAPTNKGVYLNLTRSTFASGSNWLTENNTTKFGITVGQISGGSSTMLAYCFADVEGYSKFGSYTGNGNADGPFVYTGFKPKMVIIKNISAAFDWVILDTERNPYNLVHDVLYPSLANAEADATTYASFDAVSNGFKLRNTHQYTNFNGYNYIYMAFAENPFKNSTAR